MPDRTDAQFDKLLATTIDFLLLAQGADDVATRLHAEEVLVAVVNAVSGDSMCEIASDTRADALVPDISREHNTQDVLIDCATAFHLNVVIPQERSTCTRKLAVQATAKGMYPREFEERPGFQLHASMLLQNLRT